MQDGQNQSHQASAGPAAVGLAARFFDRAALLKTWERHRGPAGALAAILAALADVLTTLGPVALWIAGLGLAGCVAATTLGAVHRPFAAVCRRCLVYGVVTIVLAVGLHFLHQFYGKERGILAANIRSVADLQKALGIDKLSKDVAATRANTEKLVSDIAEIKQLVSSLILSSAVANPAQAGALTEAVSAAARSPDTRMAEALSALKAGKVADAEALFRSVAEEKSRRIVSDRKAAAAAYRNLGAIAALRDPKRALEAYARAVEFEPDDSESLYWVGTIRFDRGETADAQVKFERVVQLNRVDPKRDLRIWAHFRLGDIWAERGAFPHALAEYEAARKLIAAWIAAGLRDAAEDRELMALNNRIGQVLYQQGEFERAQEHFMSAYAVAERVAAAKPDDADWQRDLYIAHGFVGMVVLRQGQSGQAIAHFRKALAIQEALVGRDPAHANRRNDLVNAHRELGDALRARGDVDEAIAHYLAALPIAEQLAASDPSNGNWRRRLAMVQIDLGAAYFEKGNREKARESYEAGLAIYESLTAVNPDNKDWSRDLGLTHLRLGDLESREGRLGKARQEFETAREIFLRLKAQSPDNALVAGDVARAEARIAELKD